MFTVWILVIHFFYCVIYKDSQINSLNTILYKSTSPLYQGSNSSNQILSFVHENNHWTEGSLCNYILPIGLAPGLSSECHIGCNQRPHLIPGFILIVKSADSNNNNNINNSNNNNNYCPHQILPSKSIKWTHRIRYVMSIKLDLIFAM